MGTHRTATFGHACHLCGAAPLDAVDFDGAVICTPCLRRLDATPQLKRRIFFRFDALSA